MVIETGAFYFVNENDSLEHDEIVILSKYTYCEKRRKSGAGFGELNHKESILIFCSCISSTKK